MSPTATTTYTVTVVDVNGCSDTASVIIIVNSLPIVTFSGLDSSYCLTDPVAETMIGSPSGGTFNGPGINENNFEPFNAGVGNHTITYTYTDGNNCTNSYSQIVSVNACTGIKGISFAKGVSLFPNPSNGKFILELNQVEKMDLNISIINMLGREIFSEMIGHFKGTYKEEFDLSGHSSGIYLLKIRANKEDINRKINIK